MVWRNVPRQLSAVVMGSVLLGGCGQLSNEFGHNGVGIPAPTEIAAFYEETDKGSALSKGRRLKAGEYLLTSLTYTNEKCHVFFEKLEAFKQDSEFLDKVLTAAIAAGSPLLSLNASAEAIANVTSGIASASLLNQHKTDIYAFATFKESLKQHVIAEMADFQAKRGLDLYAQWEMGVVPDYVEQGGIKKLALRTNPQTYINVSEPKAVSYLKSDSPSHLLLARSIAADYAAICSLANMRRIIEASLNVTTTQSSATLGNPIAPSTSDTVAKTETPREGQVPQAPNGG